MNVPIHPPARLPAHLPHQPRHQPPQPLSIPADIAVADIEQARADFYAVTAHLLMQAPAPALLAKLAHADPVIADDHCQQRFADAWERLRIAADLIDADAVREEYDALFVATGTPELNPYASFYLTGFMMERPLAALRRDLGRLGFARARDATELEDHIGVLCETARLMILQQRPLRIQQAFLATHLFPWVQRFTADLRRQPVANFYRVLADFIDAFMQLEIEAFGFETSGIQANGDSE